MIKNVISILLIILVVSACSSVSKEPDKVNSNNKSVSNTAIPKGKDSRYYIKFAKEFTSKGKYDEAIEIINESISSEPKNPKNFAFLGMLYQKKDNHKLAIENINKAIALDPNEGIYYANLAISYKKLGKMDLAKQNVEKAKSLSPKFSKFLDRLIK